MGDGKVGLLNRGGKLNLCSVLLQPLFPIIQRACLPYLVFASLLTVFFQKPFKNSRICLFLGFFGPLGQLLSFLGHQNYLFSKNIYVIVFYHIRALIWCATHAYSAYLKNDPEWGGNWGSSKMGGNPDFNYTLLQIMFLIIQRAFLPILMFVSLLAGFCKKFLKISVYVYFWAFLVPRDSFCPFWDTKIIFSKKYICNSILPPQSFHLMCNTCILFIFEKLPQIGGGRIAQKKGGAIQISILSSFKYCFFII